MNGRLERTTIAVLAALLMILSAIAYTSFHNARELMANNAAVMSTHNVLEHLTEISFGLAAAESSARGYVLTGSADYLDQYQQQSTALPERIKRLSRELSDDAEQQQSATVLQRMLAQRLELMSDVVSRRSERGFEAAHAIVMTRHGKELTDRIAVVIAGMRGREEVRLHEREARAALSTRRTWWVLTFGTFIAIVAVIGASVIVVRDGAARQRAQQRLAAQHAVAEVLAGAAGHAGTTAIILATLGQRMGWAIGELWVYNPNLKTLRCAHSWHADARTQAEHERATKAVSIARGEGLAGMVFRRRRPLWVSSLATSRKFQRADMAARLQMRSAIAFPIKTADQVFGVIEFLSPKDERPDRELSRALETLGMQIGQFLQRRETEESLRATTELYDAIYKSANYSIIAVGPDARITSVNATAERWLQWTAAELVGKSPAVLHDGAEIARRAAQLSQELGFDIEPGFEAFVAKAQLGVADENEWTYVRKDGTRFPVLLSVTTLRSADGELNGYVGIASDITERKQIERMKDEFISVVSHELRTPLTSMRGSLGLLASGVLGKDSDQAVRMLQIAVSNTDRLIHLINDILDIEKLASGKEVFYFRAVNAGELMTQAAENTRALAEAANVELVVEALDAVVAADSDRLLQVLTNLLGNAIKFSSAGTRVFLAASMNNGEVVFSVADTGRGIPAEKQSAIFERFQQVDASDSREKGGTGLGLAIARSTVNQHGGRIWVESELGRGSTFFVAIPCAKRATAS